MVRVEFSWPFAEEAQVESSFEEAVEVVGGDEILELDLDRLIETAGFGGTEHDALRDVGRLGKGAQSTARRAGTCCQFAQAGPLSEPYRRQDVNLTRELSLFVSIFGGEQKGRSRRSGCPTHTDRDWS